MKKIDAISAAKMALLKRRLQEHRVDRQVPLAARIPPRPPEGPLPLSLNQEGLWFIDRLEPGQPNYNIPGIVRLEGRLDREALRRTLECIVHRHEVLRTTFRAGPSGAPEQVIHAPGRFELPLVDLTASGNHFLEEASRWAAAEARTPFDLESGPLFRASLLRGSEREHVLVFNMHHIVSDGWSLGIFRDEMGQLYGAFAQGEASPLSELPFQFADYARWERAELATRETNLAYWAQQLAGAPHSISLPADLPRPARLSYRGAHRRLRLGAALSDALRAFAAREGVSLYMLLLAGFYTQLALLSGQADLVIGAGIANRGHSDLERLIGYFVRILPLRIRPEGDPTFRSLLVEVRRATLEASEYQVPLSLLARELQPPRDPGRNPFFQVEFTLLTPDVNPGIYDGGISGVDETIELPDLTISPLEMESGVARFDLAVFLWDMPQGLTGTVEYCRDLFLSQTIEKWIDHYQNILQLVIARPDVRISEAAGQLQAFQSRLDEEKKAQAHTAMRAKFDTLKRRSGSVGGRD